jgi:hypothetical protein
MDVRLLGFGSIQVEGRAYEHDIVIDRGAVRKRSKKPSKPYRDKFGHTPLSADEELPWGGPRLIIGTGAHGSLPIMPEVAAEAARRNIDLVAVPTEQACRLIAGLKQREVRSGCAAGSSDVATKRSDNAIRSASRQVGAAENYLVRVCCASGWAAAAPADPG